MKGKTEDISQKINNKRYLIVQFKKAFYPLSLNLEDHDKDKLKDQIRRLKMEMEEIKSETKSMKSTNNGEFFVTENNGHV